jgi:tetratricopeptide (TPR) repeat protein
MPYRVACLIGLLLTGRVAGCAVGAQETGQARAEETTLRNAESLIEEGRPLDALAQVSALLESSPDSVPALKLYARVQAYSLDNDSGAELTLEKCLRLAPSDPETWQALGDLHLAQRRTPEAIRCLETAVRFSPSNALLLAHLATAYGKAEELEKAAALFVRCLDLNRHAAQPNARVTLHYAEYLLDQNDAAGSIPLFTESLKLNPKSSEANFGRARAHERLQQWEEAAADALAALQYSPVRLDAHLLLVRAYGALNDQAKLQEYLARVKRLEEDQRAQLAARRNSEEALRLYMDVVQRLLQEQKYAEAIQPSRKIIELWPSFAQPLFVLGICYGQTGQPDEAIVFLTKYLAMQPRSGDGHAALGALLLQQGRQEEARQELRRAVEIDPELSEAQRLLNEVLPRAGQTDVAQVDVAPPQATPTPNPPPDSESPAQMMARAAQLLSRDPVGLQAQIEPLVRKAASARPLDPEAHYLYGQWACLNGRHDVSIRELNKALELTRNNDRARMLAHAYLALTYAGSREASKADLEYRQALELDRKLAVFEPLVFLDYVKFLESEDRELESQKLVAELLRRAPQFGPAHLERAQFLYAQDKLEDALAEGRTALTYAGQDAQVQRRAHIFLAKVCHGLGRKQEASLHQAWITAQSKP